MPLEYSSVSAINYGIFHDAILSLQRLTAHLMTPSHIQVISLQRCIEINKENVRKLKEVSVAYCHVPPYTFVGGTLEFTKQLKKKFKLQTIS